MKTGRTFAIPAKGLHGRAMERRLRMGMVGGGPGAFIGAVHKMAAELDGNIELVAGCFSRSVEKNKAAGERWRLRPERVYASFEDMAASEAGLPREERIDFVTVVTPNYLHYPVAKAFIEAGINVVSDKPATHSLEEALELRDLLQQHSGVIYALTHNYTAYPMVRQARAMVREGKLGRILKVISEYPQEWMLAVAQQGGDVSSGWRTDPKQGGASNTLADVGTHAENLGRFITGLEIDALCADFESFVPGNQLEDDANLLIRYRSPNDGKPTARGILYASQMSAGEENGPHLRIYGTQGSLEWHQPEPNTLIFRPLDAPAQTLRAAASYTSEEAKRLTRLPSGHPEGFLEAFANLYSEIGRAIWKQLRGETSTDRDFPGIHDAVLGMAFIETAVKSAASKEKWTQMPQL